MKIIKKVSAGGVVIEGDQVLTLFVPDYNETVFPKGTLEEGETPEEAATRELLEETGYHVSILSKIDTISYEFEEDNKFFIKTVHFFLMKLSEVDEIPSPHREKGEDFENRWLQIPEALSELTHEESRSLLKKALELRSFES